MSAAGAGAVPPSIRRDLAVRVVATPGGRRRLATAGPGRRGRTTFDLSESMGCLDAKTVFDLVGHRLPDDEAHAAFQHVDVCDVCAALVDRVQLLAGGTSAGALQRLRGSGVRPAPGRGVPPTRASEPSVTAPARPLEGFDPLASLPALAARWEVRGILGAGGMGVVYRAVERATGRAAALKCILGAHCDERSRARFRREVEAVQALHHPNVVGVVAAGEVDGALTLAMELLEGEDLGARVARGPLPPSEVARIGVQAAAGLAAAHDAGIVHRDVKPANLFLCMDGTVKLLDFGLALPMDGGSEDRLTATSLLVGTPAFMSVEQVRGTRDEDPRTDVWGLGATLYRAVAGRAPFEAPTSTAQLVRVATDEPDPLPPHVPVWLATTLLRCMQKSKDARWPSMRELGAALVEGLAVGSGAEEHAPAHEGLGDEVRVMAVLYAEDIRDLRSFEAAVRAEHGTASALLGHRAVGVFGGELWRGDEAERAVRAGLAVRSATGTALRLGVGTGRAVRARAGDVAGAVVAAATGAQSTRGVGVCPETVARIRGGFDLEGPIVVAARRGQRVVGVRGLAAADAPLVGREVELGLLEATMKRVCEESEAAGVLLVGPEGIGKSRLLHALAAAATALSERPILLEARGEAQRADVAWHTLGVALRGLFELPEGTPPAEAYSRIRALSPTPDAAEFLGEMLGAAVPDSPRLRGARTDPRAMADQVVLAVGDLLAGLASAGPVVLFVDDAHWADRPSQRAIELLLRRLERAPLFVVAAAHPEAELILPDLRRVPLGALPRRATRAIVAGVLGDDSLAEEIHERCGGNPYFAEELALARRGGVADLPASVEAAVQARLDALPRAERDLLRRASVLGRRFWAEALEVMGEPDADALLGMLRRRELVVPEARARLVDTREWSFRHAVTQEVALASLTEEQRAHLHRAAAGWLAARPDAPAQEVARHFEAAGDTSSAARLWLRAAFTAFRAGDASAVLDASARALSRAPDRTEALRLRAIRAEVLAVLGPREDEAAEIEALGALAESPEERASWCERRATHHHNRGEYREAERAIEEGLAARPGDARLLVQKSILSSTFGRPAEARQVAHAAIDAARRTSDGGALGRALAALGFASMVEGDVGAWVPVYREALVALDAAGDTRRAATVRGNLGYAELLVGRYDEAIAILRAVRAECRAVGNRTSEGYALQNLALALARAGDAEAGRSAAREALAIAGDLALPRLELAVRASLATLELEADGPAAALEVLDAALALPEEVQGTFRPQLHALRAAALVALRRVAEGRGEAERALELRAAAGGMEEREAELFLAAADAGVPGALAQGAAALAARAARISDPDMRMSFLARVPAHARLVERAGSAGLD